MSAPTTATATDVALDELQTRLQTFTQQLVSIHELLETDPQNTEFLGIANDLVEVIRLTKEMIDLKLESTNNDPHQRIVSSAQASAAAAAQPSTSTLDTDLQFPPGSVCEVLTDAATNVWCPALVDAVTSHNTYNVQLFSLVTPQTKRHVTATELRPIAAAPPIRFAGALPPREAIASGYACEARYYVDQQFYACVVTNVTPRGFAVLFQSYNNAEEVPYAYLRALPPPSDASTTAAPAKQSSAMVSKPLVAPIAAPIKIPDNLTILPTDTDAEKERKRKRIRAIKSANRHKTIDNERNSKQNGWQAFQHKAKKRKVEGASGVLSKRGTSMFASPAGYGGRVGVMGSGQGMTAFTDARKKIKTTGGAGSVGGGGVDEQ